MSKFLKHRRTELVKRIPVVAFGLALGLILVEILIRWLDPYPYIPPWEKNHSEHGNLMQFDPTLGWRGVPNSSEWFVTESARVWLEHNQSGFRDINLSERSLNKPSIVFLGDSFTWGYEVAFDDMFVNLLRPEFPERELFNLAHRGYGTDQSLLVFREWNESPDVELVILMFSENDFGDNEAEVRGGRPKPKFEIVDDDLVLSNVPLEEVDEWRADPPMPQGPDSFIDYARLVLFQSQLLHELNFRRKLLQRPISEEEVIEKSKSAPQLELSRRIFLELKEEVEARGAHLIVVAVPSKLQFMGFEGAVPYQTYLRDLCQASDIEYLDLSPYFERTLLRAYFRESMHWTAHGHEIAAEAINDYLKNRQTP